MARITQKTFLKALVNSGGNQSRIAERMEVGRSAIGEFLKRQPKMRVLLDIEAERLVDVAEDNIATDVMVHRDVDSSKWLLTNSKKGKRRGWGQKQEIEHSGDQQFIFKEIVLSDEEIKKMKNDKTNDSEPKTT